MSNLSNAIKSDVNTGKNQVKNASQDVAKEFKSFLSDVEDLFQSANSSEDFNKAKAQLKQRVASAKESISDAGENIFHQARKTATITNNYVHENPWVAIGTGVAVSFLVGLLISRRN